MLLHEENVAKVFEIIQSDSNFITSSIEPDFRISWESASGQEEYYLSEVTPVGWHVIYVLYNATDVQVHPNSPFKTDAMFYVPFAVKRKYLNQPVSFDTLSNDHSTFLQEHSHMLDTNGNDMVFSYVHLSQRSNDEEDYDKVIGSHLVLTDTLNNKPELPREYSWLYNGLEYVKDSFDSAGASCDADFVNGTYNMSLLEYLEYELDLKYSK